MMEEFLVKLEDALACWLDGGAPLRYIRDDLRRLIHEARHELMMERFSAPPRVIHRLDEE